MVNSLEVYKIIEKCVGKSLKEKLSAIKRDDPKTLYLQGKFKDHFF